MSIIRTHIEQILHEAISQRTYTPDQVRKVVVGASRFIQKAYKRVNKLYIHALMSYPELWSDESLIKSASRSPARDDFYIINTLNKLNEHRARYEDSPTIKWYRDAYSKCQFGGPLPKEAVAKKEEKKEDGLWIKTEILEKVNESTRKKGNARKIKKVKNLQDVIDNQSIFKKDD